MNVTVQKNTEVFFTFSFYTVFCINSNKYAELFSGNLNQDYLKIRILMFGPIYSSFHYNNFTLKLFIIQ